MQSLNGIRNLTWSLDSTMASNKKHPAGQKKSASPVATIAKLERHPLSVRFALPTSDEERLALASDMEVNGQHNDIILFEGKVLDGWERYMGCLQKGITPKFKEYTGTDPGAVAFGTNMIRRRLSSVQKAVFAAEYMLYVEENEVGNRLSQKEVAKLACVGLTRLNEVLKLFRSDADEAKKMVQYLKETPEVTGPQLQKILIDCGVVNKPEEKIAPPASNDLDDDEADDDDESIDGAVDVDDLLDEDDEDETPAVRAKRKDDDKGEASNVHYLDGGRRIGHDKKAHETPASACASKFKAMTESERMDFVKFAWPTLRPALEKAIADGRITWEPAVAQADPSRAAFADAVDKLAVGKGKPRVAANDKPAPTKRGRKAA